METISMMSVNDLKSITSISNNIDVDTLQPFIYNAQVLYIKPVLTNILYDDIILVLSTGGTKYQNLLESWVFPALAHWTWHNASIFLHVKSYKVGLVLQHSDTSDNIDLETFATYSKRIESLAQGYTNILREYLDEDQGVLYPLYRRNTEDSYEMKRAGHSIYLGFKNRDRLPFSPKNGWWI